MSTLDELTEQALISHWIEGQPERLEEVRLANYGIEVWAVVGYARSTDGDLAEVARSYELPIDAVRAALAYYQRHPLQIDARLELNAAAHAG